MFYLYWFVYTVILEFWVYCEELRAKHDKTFDREEMENKWPGRTVLPFNRHGGMIGDRYIVSPLAGWLLASYLPVWSAQSIVMALILSTVVMGAIFWHWTRSTKDGSVDSFAEDGIARFNGWLHYFYAIVALTPILLFFFKTPHVPRVEVVVVSILVAIHLALGMLQPAYYTKKQTNKRIGLDVYIPFGILLGIIAAAAYRMVS